jgi:hypothetical protein
VSKVGVDKRYCSVSGGSIQIPAKAQAGDRDAAYDVVADGQANLTHRDDDLGELKQESADRGCAPGVI